MMIDICDVCPLYQLAVQVWFVLIDDTNILLLLVDDCFIFHFS